MSTVLHHVLDLLQFFDFPFLHRVHLELLDSSSKMAHCLLFQKFMVRLLVIYFLEVIMSLITQKALLFEDLGDDFCIWVYDGIQILIYLDLSQKAG